MSNPTAAPEFDPSGAARAAADALARVSGVSRHDVAVVLGSGWRTAADAFGSGELEIPMTELPGFAAPAVPGHPGTVRSVPVGSRRVLVLRGRTHLYEGHGTAQVVHGVRVGLAAGAAVVVLTNAAGGIRDGLAVGQPVMITDHLNLTGGSPLVGPRFVDLTGAYSPRLRELARRLDPSLAEGVYAGLAGPHFETPAEIRMLRDLGADLVGMSTVLETIAARAAGAEVFGLSLVTNLAAGMTGEPIDPLSVPDVARASAGRMGELLRALVTAL